MDKEALDQHISNEGLIQHITFMAAAIKTLQSGIHGDGEDSGLAEADNSMVVSNGGIDGHPCRPITDERCAAPSKIKLRAQRIQRDGPTVDPFQNVYSNYAAEMTKIRDECDGALMTEMKKKDAEIAQLREVLSKLNKKLQSNETESEDRGFRLSLLENVSYDGTMVWKIPQFSQRMVDAQSGKYTSIFSLPFYTSRYGYKLCLRLYILGDGIGKGTHMSLFFVVMRGEFDNILQWPFTHKVTFRLLNQAGGKDITDGFLPDPMSSSFKKPKTDMNVASGCPRFVSIGDVRSGGFIADDTIFIKAKVENTPASSH